MSSPFRFEFHAASGPSAYGAPKLAPPGGGKFSTAVAKSDIDWMVYVQMAALSSSSSLLITTITTIINITPRPSATQPLSPLTNRRYRAKSMPGPGAYGNPVLKENLGGKFNLSNPKSDVDWMVCLHSPYALIKSRYACSTIYFISCWPLTLHAGVEK